MLPADQALVARENLIANLRMEHPVTRRVIDAIPLDKGDYSPDAVTKSAVDLAWHIVAAEHRFLDAVVTGVFNYGNSGRPAEIATLSPSTVISLAKVSGGIPSSWAICPWTMPE